MICQNPGKATLMSFFYLTKLKTFPLPDEKDLHKLAKRERKKKKKDKQKKKEAKLLNKLEELKAKQFAKENLQQAINSKTKLVSQEYLLATNSLPIDKKNTKSRKNKSKNTNESSTDSSSSSSSDSSDDEGMKIKNKLNSTFPSAMSSLNGHSRSHSLANGSNLNNTLMAGGNSVYSSGLGTTSSSTDQNQINIASLLQNIAQVQNQKFLNHSTGIDFGDDPDNLDRRIGTFGEVTIQNKALQRPVEKINRKYLTSVNGEAINEESAFSKNQYAGEKRSNSQDSQDDSMNVSNDNPPVKKIRTDPGTRLGFRKIYYLTHLIYCSCSICRKSQLYPFPFRPEEASLPISPDKIKIGTPEPVVQFSNLKSAHNSVRDMTNGMPTTKLTTLDLGLCDFCQKLVCKNYLNILSIFSKLPLFLSVKASPKKSKQKIFSKSQSKNDMSMVEVLLIHMRFSAFVTLLAFVTFLAPLYLFSAHVTFSI